MKKQVLVFIFSFFIVCLNLQAANKVVLNCQTHNGEKFYSDGDKAWLQLKNKKIVVVLTDKIQNKEDYSLIFTGKQKVLSVENEYSCPDEKVDTYFLQKANLYTKGQTVLLLDFDCQETLYLSTLGNVECP